jgi:hypothetical protein
MNTYLSLDLETFGIEPTSAIASIGIVDIFNGAEFYDVLSLSPQLCMGATTNRETMDWWGNQSGRGELEYTKSLRNEGTSPEYTLYLLKVFLEDKPNPVWVCRGTDFDIPILAHFYRLLGERLPGAYNAKVDLRSLRKFFPRKTKAANPFPHHALYDARFQADDFREFLEEYGDKQV